MAYLEDLKGFPEGLLGYHVRSQLDVLRRMCFLATTPKTRASSDILSYELRAVARMNTSLTRHRRPLRVLSVRPDSARQHHVTVDYQIDGRPARIYLSLYPRSKRLPAEEEKDV